LGVVLTLKGIVGVFTRGEGFAPVSRPDETQAKHDLGSWFSLTYVLPIMASLFLAQPLWVNGFLYFMNGSTLKERHF